MSLVRSRAVMFANRGSRRSEQWFPEAEKLLREGGIRFEHVRLFKRPSDLMASVKQARDSGVELIVVGGGDGTMSGVAGILSGSNSTLGVLPLGTGNAFAKDLDIPVSVEAACDVIISGSVRNVDVGMVGPFPFVNVASIGVTTRIALGLHHLDKKRFGRSVYLVSLLQALALVRPFRVELTVDGDDAHFESLQVVIGNGRFHGGPFLLDQDASISDGLLTVYALTSSSKGAFLRMSMHLLSGTQSKLEDVVSYRVKSGVLRTNPTRRVTVDGEVRLRTPVDFREMPGALRVLVPFSVLDLE